MQTTQLPSLADRVATQPAAGAASDRQLQRLVDFHAAAEASSALHAAAARAARENAGLVATVLASAEAVLRNAEDGAARDRLRDAISPELLSRLTEWMGELREVAATRPDSGACTVASALDLWSWTIRHIEPVAPIQAVDELAGVLAPMLAARALALDVAEREERGIRADLSHVYAAHASALAGAACAEVVFGYRRHLVWDAEGCASCFAGDDLDELEALMPGIASGARMSTDVVEADGSHPVKAGPCASFTGVDSFIRLRSKLDGCLTGARLAKDRAAAAIAGRA